jgi:arylsulfatase A-like enzyme
MFGKWHLGPGDEHHPSQRGFDQALASQGKHFNFVTRPPVEDAKDAYHADYMTDRAVDFISRHKARPFFLYLPHFLVHTPIDPKPGIAEAWKKKPARGTHWNPDYAAMIQSLDESVGRVMQAIADAGIADHTLVIFTSDNGGVGGYYRTEAPSKNRGTTDNAPLSGGKGTLREGGVRVPFIARWPGTIPAGSVCETPIAHVDLMPTFAALSGAALPEQPIDGVDISPLLGDAAATLKRDALFLHFPVYLQSYVHDNGWRTTPGSFIIAGNWKLIEYFEDGRKELFHLGEDIGETRNLLEAQPDMARKLHDRLVAWRSEVGAAMPELLTHPKEDAP